MPIEAPNPNVVRRDVQRALDEDIGSGDATADLLPAEAVATARVITREEAVIAGTAWFDACFDLLDPSVKVKWECRDGDRVAADDLLCTLQGPARALVSGERCALNFLQALVQVSSEITSTLRLDRLLQIIVNSPQTVLPFERCSIALDQRGRVRDAVRKGPGRRGKPDEPAR